MRMSIVGGGIGAPAKSRQPTSPQFSHTQPSNPSSTPSVTIPDRSVTIPESAVTLPDRPVTIGRNTQQGRLRLSHFGQIDDLQLGALIGQLLAEATSKATADSAALAAAPSGSSVCADGACSLED